MEILDKHCICGTNEYYLGKIISPDEYLLLKDGIQLPKHLLIIRFDPFKETKWYGICKIKKLDFINITSKTNDGAVYKMSLVLVHKKNIMASIEERRI